MTPHVRPLHSLKTRILLSMMVLFLTCMWGLSMYASRMLRVDMEKLSSDQQFSTVSVVATQINGAVSNRFKALQFASEIAAQHMGDSPQSLLETFAQRPFLATLFNEGVVLHRLDGTVYVGGVKLSAIGGSDGFALDSVTAALTEGRSTVGKPGLQAGLPAHDFLMTVPVVDKRGVVIGALSGITNLDKPNFLDEATGTYGMTGGYMLVSPTDRRVISATDKRRVMELLPGPGKNELVDRFIQGYEGSGVVVNSLGQEVLASAKRIPLSGWYVAAALPTAEAFAPIDGMFQRMILTTAILTLLAALGTWWLIGRQLAPILAVTKSLGKLSTVDSPAQMLPVTRQDEVGQLIGGFNHLVNTIANREQKLRDRETRYRTLVERSPNPIAVHQKGKLVFVNSACMQLFGAKTATDVIGMNVLDRVHPNYHEVHMEKLRALGAIGSDQPLTEVQLVKLDGSIFDATVQGTQIIFDGKRAFHVTIHDISERTKVEAMHAAYVKFREAILDSIPTQIAVLDQKGNILAANHLWRQSSGEIKATTEAPILEIPAGTFFSNIFATAQGRISKEDAALIRHGIEGVRSGTMPCFFIEYSRESDDKRHWYSLTVSPLYLEKSSLVVTQIDVTQRRELENARKEASEAEFKLIADNTADGIVTFGPDGHIIYVSPSYLKQLGYSDKSELLDHSQEEIRALVHPQDRGGLFACIDHAFVAKLTDITHAYRVKNRNGHYVWREACGKLQYDVLGRFSGACVVVRDITQRRDAENELRIAAVAFETQEPMMIADHNLVILRVNHAFTHDTGYTSADVVGRTPRIMQSERHSDEFYQTIWRTVQLTGSWQGEVWNRHKDGRVFPKWLTITAVKGRDGAVNHYVGSQIDLSERKRAESAILKMNIELTESRRQLRRLVALNESNLEKEKRHIAREVHDELGQVLTALRMDLSLAVIRHTSHSPELLADFRAMKGQVDRAIQGVRNVATSLRPAALDMGLVSAIQWLSHEFQRHGDVTCDITVPDDPIELESSREVVLFRIVQESLNNISKYARASQVNISLSLHGDELSVEIRDNGQGFDPIAVAQRGTLGLLGMRERVIGLGGRLEVHSTPGQGTVIDVFVPLDLTTDVEST